MRGYGLSRGSHSSPVATLTASHRATLSRKGRGKNNRDDGCEVIPSSPPPARRRAARFRRGKLRGGAKAAASAGIEIFALTVGGMEAQDNAGISMMSPLRSQGEGVRETLFQDFIKFDCERIGILQKMPTSGAFCLPKQFWEDYWRVASQFAFGWDKCWRANGIPSDLNAAACASKSHSRILNSTQVPTGSACRILHCNPCSIRLRTDHE